MTIKRALVVEDDRILFELIKAYLEDQGFEVIKAESAKKAMSLVTTHNFCIATVDNGLPDIEGYKLIKQMKRIKPKMKVIMITGTHKEELKRKAIENGADLFIVKDKNMNFLSDIENIIK